MFKRFLLTALALLLPSIAMAGSFENGIYKSNLGYLISPPEDWIVLDAANFNAMTGHVPRNISTQGVGERIDVIFFPAFSKVDTSKKADDKRIEANKNVADGEKQPPITDKSDPPKFAPFISVLAVKNVPSKDSAEMVKAYADKIMANRDDGISDAEGFEIVNFTKDTAYAEDIFLFNIKYRYDTRRIEVEQALMFHKEVTYIITCTNDAEDPVENDKRWCRKVITSMKFEK